MNLIQKPCEYCQKLFYAHPRDTNRGRARYCSQSCSSRVQGNRTRKLPNATCAYCGIQFHRKPCRLSSSKHQTYFCSREHKNLGQKVEHGLSNMWPEHYGTGTADYRSAALKVYPHKCDICNYTEYTAVLQVHHKDGNHSNNAIENLQILCPTCHNVQHFLARTGPWA